MYLNEADAKKKCCPVMTRIDKNEPILNDKIIKCIASNSCHVPSNKFSKHFIIKLDC